MFRKGVRKGEEFKAPHYASAAATRDYITTRNIIPNSKYYKMSLQVSPGLPFRNFLILVLTIFQCKNLDLVPRFILRKLWK